jgi:hypothetical protein
MCWKYRCITWPDTKSNHGGIGGTLDGRTQNSVERFKVSCGSINEMQELNIQIQGNMFLNLSFNLLDGKTVLQFYLRLSTSHYKTLTSPQQF